MEERIRYAVLNRYIITTLLFVAVRDELDIAQVQAIANAPKKAWPLTGISNNPLTRLLPKEVRLVRTDRHNLHIAWDRVRLTSDPEHPDVKEVAIEH